MLKSTGIFNTRRRWVSRTIASALVCLLLVVWQGFSITALADDSGVAFAGFNNQNMNLTPSNWSTMYASVGGGQITMSGDESHAAFYLNLSSIADSVDYGSLSIRFSISAYIGSEATEELDSAQATLSFRANESGADISTATIARGTGSPGTALSLASNASVPVGTRFIFIDLQGIKAGAVNTIVFTSPSLIIYDTADPTLEASRNTAWTNQDVTITLDAADAQSGIQGIFDADTSSQLTGANQYQYTVTANDTRHFYTTDYAGRSSEIVTVAVTNIDKNAPTQTPTITLSKTTWSNTPVTFTLSPITPAAGESPETRQYKLGGGTWTAYAGQATVSTEGQTVITARTADEAGNASGVSSKTAYVDTSNPVVTALSAATHPSGGATVTFTASDAVSGLAERRWAQGTRDAAYFATGGTLLTGSTFEISAGGDYTGFAKDNAGNTVVSTININTYPLIDAISSQSVNEDETKDVVFGISDSETPAPDLTVSAVSSNATLLPNPVCVNTSGSVRLTLAPATNLYGGPVTVTVSVTDGYGDTATRQFSVTVNSVNDAPIAVNDDAATNEDQAVIIHPLANDTDIEGDTLSIAAAGTPAHGTVTIAPDHKSLTYTPNANTNGTDSFTYTITDGMALSNAATITVSVTEINDTPVAHDDTYSLIEDDAPLLDVLANDTDADIGTTPDEALTLQSVGTASHGTAVIEAGRIRYTPAANWSGSDSFAYTIADRLGVTSTATVHLIVEPFNDAPELSGVEASYTIAEDAIAYEIQLQITDVETNNASLMLQAASYDETILPQSGITITGLGDADPAASVWLTPKADANGDVSVSLKVSDGFKVTEKTFVLHVTPVNDLPVAQPDSFRYTEDDDSLIIDMDSLVLNDTDVDRDPLTFEGIASGPTAGTLTVIDAEENTYRYTPPANYDRTVTFEYLVGDGTGTSSGTVTLYCDAVNDPPVLELDPDNITTTDEDVTLSDILFSIYDLESAPSSLIVTVGSSNPETVAVENIAITRGENGACSLSIAPNPNAYGTSVITITVSDGSYYVSDSFLMTVNSVEDPPTATDDDISLLEAGSVSFLPMANDYDADNDIISLVSFAQPAGGTVTRSGDVLTYKAAPGFTGMDSFTYTITDGKADATATVNAAVGTYAHSPTLSAIANQFISEYGETAALPFTAQDVDAGDVLTVTATSGNIALVPQDSAHLVLTDLGGGHYTLKVVTAPNASGLAVITVTVKDLMENTVSKSFAVTVYATNDPPSAVNDTVEVDEDQSISIDVLANDSDAETAHEDLRVIGITAPAHGYLSGSAGLYTYTPYANFNGTDSFTYTMTDGAASATATVNITVVPVEDAPYVHGIWRELPNDSGSESAVIAVLSSAYDADGDTVYLDAMVTAPRHGTAVINPDSTITYTRTSISAESNGADSFTFRVRDRESTGEDVRYGTGTVYIGTDFIPTQWTGNVYASAQEDAPAFWISLNFSNPNSDVLEISTGSPSLGTVTQIDTDNRRILYSPDPNANGHDSFNYTVTDHTLSQTTTAIVSVYLYPVNDPPVFTLTPEDTTTDEDVSTAQLSVAFEDVDTPGNLIFTAHAQNADPARPVLLGDGISIDRSGNTATLVLTPVANANGSAQVTLLVSDGMASDTYTFTLTVTPVNDAPTAEDQAVTMREDTSVTFSVVTPNSDIDGDSVTASIPTGGEPEHGVVEAQPDGTVTYTPAPDFFGMDSFTFMLDDGRGGTDTGTVTVTVENVNDLPLISGLQYRNETAEDTSIVLPFTVTDADNDPLSLSFTSTNPALFPDGSITVSGTGAARTLTAVPAPNAFGTATITLHVHDAVSETVQPLLMNVYSVNDLPVAEPDEYAINEDTPTVLPVLANDSDIEDTTLRIVAVSATTNGGTVVNNGGTLTYTPPADYYGTDGFGYTVSDSSNGRSSTTVSITILSVNDAPNAVDDEVATEEDTPVTLDVLVNDTDVEGNPLTVTSVSASALGGSAVINPDETLTFTPAENSNGTDTFTYTVSDGQAENSTATATVTVHIASVNDVPVITNNAANPGTWTFDEDTQGIFLFNVSDVETDAKNLIMKMYSSVPSLIPDTSITLDGAGGTKTITLIPLPNANGDCDITVSASDGINTTTRIFPVHVTAINDRPSITAGDKTTSEDTPVSGAATGSDVESTVLTFSARTEAGDGPHHGVVVVQPSGSYTYTPDADFNGTDSFVILVDDGSGAANSTNEATVAVTVTPVNDAPVAQDDNAVTNEDTPVDVDVLGNDTDVDMDPALNTHSEAESITLVAGGISGVVHGTAAITDGKIRFTPTANWNGSETFTYTIRDVAGLTDTASVTVTVNPVDDAPANGNDAYTVVEDTPRTLAVLANDDVDTTTNPTLEVLTVTGIVTAPQHGTAQIAADNKSITYSPAANYFGPDSLTYSMKDLNGESHGHTAQFTVSLTVTPVNDLPVISAIPAQTIDEDTSTGALSFTVSDVEDDDALLAVTASSSNTVLFPNNAANITINNTGGSNRTLTLTPAANRNGTAVITLRVRDSNNATATTVCNVTVTAVNDPPAAVDDTATTDENTPVIVDILANDDTDLWIEGDTLHIISVTDTDATHLGTFETIIQGGREKLLFTPDANWTNTASAVETLEYVMTDAAALVQSTAHVAITITPVNDAPVISDIPAQSFDEDAPGGTGQIAFSVTDEEDDDDTLAVTAVSNNQSIIPNANITIVNPAGGTGAERTIQAVSAPNTNGDATITVTVTDSLGRTATDTFTITVNPVNDAPANGDDTYTVTEDTPTLLSVLANDDVDTQTNPDLENLTILEIVTPPSHGTAQISGKDLRYTPAQDSNEDDMLQYKMQDAMGLQGTFTVTIHITPVNDAPDMHSTITDKTTDEGVAIGPFSFTVTDVDDDDAILSVTATSSNQIMIPNANITVVNAGGSDRTVSITPAGKWNGISTITLTVKDDENAYDAGSITTFKVTVREVNEPPVARDDLNYIINEDTTATLNVLSNDTDGDLLTNPLTETMTITTVAGVDNGTVNIIDSGKKLQYIPAANWNGTEDFTYTIRDTAGATSTAAVRVKVSGKNDAPVAVNDTATTLEDTTVLIDALANDSDVDMSVPLNQDPNADPANESISITENAFSGVDGGTVSVVSGKIRYVPTANWNGTDVFTYTIRDVAGATATATVSLTITPVNDAPVAVNDSATMNEDNPATISILANDSDVDQSAALNHPVTDTWTPSLTTLPLHGTAVLNLNKTVTYTPATNWNGTDSFTYTITDASGASATATVSLTVNQVNDAPVAVDDTATTAEDTTVLIDALANDSDVDMSAALNANPGAESISITAGGFSGVDGGTVSVVGGKIRYVPTANWNGTDVFTYTIRDVAGATATATVSLTITPVNDAPVAVNDSATMNEDNPATISILANDSDVDQSAALNHPVTDTWTPSLTTLPLHGTAVLNLNKTVTYTPATNWNGTDSFTYTIEDASGASATATVTLTVSAVNDAPVAVDDTAETAEDTAVLIDVLANDSDVDQSAALNHPVTDTWTPSLTTLPLHGTAVLNANKTVTYTPATNWNGTDSFTYTIEDSAGASATATVTLTVSAVNDAPVAVDDTAETAEDTAVLIDALANDSDVDMDTALNFDPAADPADEYLTITSDGFSGVDHGTVEISAGKIRFTPEDKWNGIETFTYTVSDVAGATATATVTLTVNSSNNAPTAEADTAETDEDTGIQVDVLANDTDPDLSREGDNLTIVSVDGVDHGSVAVAADLKTLTFTPAADWNGIESFTYTMQDKEHSQSTALVTVTVNPVNDAPHANADTAETSEDTPITVSVLTNDTDVDLGMEGDSLTIFSTSAPGHGTVVIADDHKTVRYSPDADWNGIDTFNYTMQDAYGAQSQAEVTVTVNPVNDAPVPPVLLTPTAGEAFKDSQTVHVTWTPATDVDKDTLKYSLYFYDGSAWALLAANLMGTTFDHVLTDTGLTTDRACYRVEVTDGIASASHTGDNFIIDNLAPQGVTASLRKGSSLIASGAWANADVSFSLGGGHDLLPFTYSYRVSGAATWTTLSEGEGVLFSSNGTYAVDYRAVDALGNTHTGTSEIRIDKLVPAAPQVSLSTTRLTNKDVVLTLALLADPGQSGNYALILPDGTLAADLGNVVWTARKNGTYTFTLVDRAGNRLAVPVTVANIDKTPPVIKAENNGYVYGDWSPAALGIDLVYTDSGSGLAYRRFALGDTPDQSDSPQNYISKLVFGEDGMFYIHASAQDKASNTASEVFGPYKVDMTPPELTLSHDATAEADGKITVTFTDALSGVVRLILPDGTTAETTVSPYTLSVDASGDYTVEVRDAAGNTATKSISVKLRPSVDGERIAWGIGAGLLALLLLLLLILLLRPVRIEYNGKRISDGEPWKRVRRRFAHVPAKDGVLPLDTTINTEGITIESITVTFRRWFTRRMRARGATITFNSLTIGEGHVPADATGSWETVNPIK